MPIWQTEMARLNLAMVLVGRLLAVCYREVMPAIGVHSTSHYWSFSAWKPLSLCSFKGRQDLLVFVGFASLMLNILVGGCSSHNKKQCENNHQWLAGNLASKDDDP